MHTVTLATLLISVRLKNSVTVPRTRTVSPDADRADAGVEHEDALGGRDVTVVVVGLLLHEEAAQFVPPSKSPVTMPSISRMLPTSGLAEPAPWMSWIKVAGSLHSPIGSVGHGDHDVDCAGSVLRLAKHGEPGEPGEAEAVESLRTQSAVVSVSVPLGIREAPPGLNGLPS